MSKFVRNMRKAGAANYQRRYRAQGRPLATFGGADIRIRYPLPTFLSAVERMERRVLLQTGGYMLRTYRDKTHGLGKRPPQKFTKRKKLTKRYKREVVEQAIRPPYRQTGILYRSVDFVVNETEGSVIAGPPAMPGLSPHVKSSLPVPQLLDKGGFAMIRHPIRGRWRRTVYRQFPYRDRVMQKSTEFMMRKLQQVGLRS